MKRIKEIVIFVLIVAVLLTWLFLPNPTLYLFGNFIAEEISFNLQILPVFLLDLFLHIKFFKEYNIVRKVIYTLLSCGIAVYLVHSTADTANRFSAKEEINLPDGNKIVLYEEKNISQVWSNPETAIKVYKVKGIIAKNIGICWESLYCYDYCLKEDKWDYTYNETDKKLTLIIRYDKPKDEDDPGVREKEFILE